ncbi:nucleoside deaminase [Pseudoclavibacter endophyticus]|uniref:tRNA-specific adenosine deaminase n=2 Tax=Pseudoclavibacter endophyticus TaxID=1778590 RepID=A0A6H9WQK6_9MICO|nr:nucleoside deaminase [Pseudoclavibacter endophyticus]
MRMALVEARAALATGDVPIGAVVVDPRGIVIARGRNTREAAGDPTGHAEVNALRSAAVAREDGWRLQGCTLVVTLEPCAMCAGALLAARVSTVVYGAWDDKAGAVGSVYDLVRDGRLPATATVVAGVLADECAELTRSFFRAESSSIPVSQNATGMRRPGLAR